MANLTTKNEMINDELGENHIATSAQNPVRNDAFDFYNTIVEFKQKLDFERKLKEEIELKKENDRLLELNKKLMK